MKLLNIILVSVLLVLIVADVQSQPHIDYNEFILNQLSISNQAALDTFNNQIDDNNQQIASEQNTIGIITSLSNLAGFIPVVGSVVSSLIDLGCLVASNNINDQANSIMFQQINEIIDYKLNQSKLVELNSFLQTSLGLIKELNDYMKEPINSQSPGAILGKIQGTLDSFESYTQFQVDYWSLGLFTLFANSHLQFLSHVYKNMDYYLQSEDTVGDFYSTYKSKSLFYTSYITTTAASGKNTIQASNTGLKGYQQFNNLNSYNEFLNTFVYDISNYWWTYDPILYPNGVIVENARVTVSNIIGAVYYDTDHANSYTDILNLLSSNDVYTYRGKLLSVSTRTDYCKLAPLSHSYWGSFHYLKYISSTNYIMSTQSTKTSKLGDETYSSGESENGEKTDQTNAVATSLLNTPISNVPYTRATKISDLNNKDSLFGFGFQEIGTFYGLNSVEAFLNEQTLNYPSKVVNKVNPLAYTKTNFMCFYQQTSPGAPGSYGYVPISAAIIQGGVMGFVGNDIIDENIIIQGAITQVDAQKYYQASPSNQLTYQAGTINPGLGGIGVPSGSTVIYELSFTSFDNNPQFFNLSLIANSASTSTIQVSVSYSNPSNCPSIVVSQFSIGVAFAPSYSWKVALGVQLLSSEVNYITIKNTGSNQIFLNSLLFGDLSYNSYKYIESPYDSSSSGFTGNGGFTG